MGWIILLTVLLGMWLFLIAPRRSSRAARAPFEGRAFAHRGLYELDQSIPENSLPAFQRAVENGYGAELDPLFSDVLRIFNGKQPLIVELKYGPDTDLLCEATRQMLDAYPGPACVESFHPAMVRWFWKHDPKRLRGQLSEAACFSKKHLSLPLAFMMSRLLTNFLTRPQFIAYRVGPKPLSIRVSEGMGAMKVLWTIREPEQHARCMKENHAVIFEGYRPEEGRA